MLDEGLGRSPGEEASDTLSERQHKETGAMTVVVGADEKVYPVLKLAAVLDALAAESVPPDELIAALRLSRPALSSPATRVSLHQLLDAYRYADERSHDPHFAYNTGLRLHVSAYGMYGFAILSSMNYRQTMQFAVKYHRLATPLGAINFREEGGCGIWAFKPLPNSQIDARLYKFIVEMQFGIIVSLQRDVMGSSFSVREFHVVYGPPNDAIRYPEIFGAHFLFGQSENELMFDAGWLDGTPKLGNEITYAMVVASCDALMEEFQLSVGLVGKLRERLMVNLMRPVRFDDIAGDLNMSARTLRRKLREENTSFRKVADDLRMEIAIRYLRDTELTVEDIAESLGFSDAANFRHAFRRWTKAAPHEFRGVSGGA
jgi:AraC-like DNA-binding protein